MEGRFGLKVDRESLVSSLSKKVAAVIASSAPARNTFDVVRG